MVIHSTFQDFLLFLYIHAAHIDNTYDPKELSSIKSKVGVLFPEGVDVERKLYQTIREYNAFDRSKIDELCKDSLDHFKNDSNRDKLFADVTEILEADGKILSHEEEFLVKLKQLANGKLS